MTKTRDRKKKHHRKTKKNREISKIVKILETGKIGISIVKDRKGNIVDYTHENARLHPYIERAIYSLKHPKNKKAMTGAILENDKIYMNGKSYRTNMKHIVGGKRESQVEIFFFPSYLKQLKMQNKDATTQKNKYDNFLIVNSSSYDGFIDFLTNKMEDVDNMFAFIKQERKTKIAKPTALYKHVVDLKLLNDEEKEDTENIKLANAGKEVVEKNDGDE